MNSWILRLASRVRGLFGQKRSDLEFDDEMHVHLELLAEKFMRQGMRRQDAVAAARRQFGNTTALNQRQRETRTFLSIGTLLQDVRYGLRMLGKSPGFTITAVLTLALGIGANAAIFTLVNAVLMKNLSVADPKTLVLLGDRSDCCVGAGIGDDGDYSLFPTDAYQQLKKNAPEFEELAAMQAGFASRPVVVRRDGSEEAARSVMGEFVSGNYFRTFGLQPRAGRLISDSDDIEGAPVAAVMSYSTWKTKYSSDPAIVGRTFFVNTKPVTIVGIAPEGFYGDRLAFAPPEFYFPIESMTLLANAPYVHDPAQQWLYIIGRVKPDVSRAQLQAKLSGLLRQALAPTYLFSSGNDKAKLAKVHVVLTAGGAGIRNMQEWYASDLQLLMWVSGLVLLHCVRQHCQPLAGARGEPEDGDVCAYRAGCDARTDRPATVDGKPAVGRDERDCRSCGGVCGNADAAGPYISRGKKHSHPSQPIAAGAGICFWSVNSDRCAVRRGAGMDCRESRTRGNSAQRIADNGGRTNFAAARAGGGAGRNITCAAGRRRALFAKPGQASKHRPETGVEESLHCAHQSTGRRLYATASWRSLPDYRREISCAALDR